MTGDQDEQAQEEQALGDAIRRIEEAKRRKSGLSPLSDDELNTLLQGAQAMEAQRMSAQAQQAPEPPLPAPKRRGRPPGNGAKQQANAPAEDRSAFGVSQLTAHTPLGLIEVQESSDLDALLADKTLAALIAMRLDDRFALVLPGSTERLLAALRKAGHTPKVEDRA